MYGCCNYHVRTVPAARYPAYHCPHYNKHQCPLSVWGPATCHLSNLPHWTEDSCLPASSHLPPRPPSFPSSRIMGYFWSPYLEIAIVIGLILLAISAPSHFRARNTGTVLLICWAFTGNLVILVNKLIWHDHARNIAPLWCDICESNPFFRCVRAQLVHRV